MEPGLYSLEGDEIVPVVSSNATVTDVTAAWNHVNQIEGCKSIKPTTSRAVRSPANGLPADPEAEVNWISAYNKFHTNLSKFVHNATSLLGQGQFRPLTHAEFDQEFNPDLPQPEPSRRKDIYDYITADNDAATDYIIISDDDNEEIDEISNHESFVHSGIPSFLTPAAVDQTIITTSTPIGK